MFRPIEVSPYSLENELSVVLRGQLKKEKGFHTGVILNPHLPTVQHSPIYDKKI